MGVGGSIVVNVENLSPGAPVAPCAPVIPTGPVAPVSPRIPANPTFACCVTEDQSP